MELFTFGVAQFGKSVLASVLMQFQENYLTVSSQLIFWGSHWVFGENRLKGCSYLEVPESEGLFILRVGYAPHFATPPYGFKIIRVVHSPHFSVAAGGRPRAGGVGR